MLSKWGHWSGYGGVSGGLLLTYALRSLLGIESLSLATSVHHLVKLGTPFLPLALLTISLPIVFMGWFLKNHKGTARWAYIVTVALIILSFGLVDGLWNHTLKMIVFFLRGADHGNMAGLPFPSVGSVFHEITGILQLVTAILGTYFGYQFIVNTRHVRQKK